MAAALSACREGLSNGSVGFGAGDLMPFGARAASNQAVKNRMRSVQSISKITKAMKMVAASKLRGVQQKATKSRSIWQPFTALLGDGITKHVPKTVILTVSTDRGLCGGLNSTSVKYSRALMNQTQLDKDSTASYVIIGEKGRAQLARDSKKKIAMTITETQKLPINFTQTCMIADEILKNVEYDAIRIVYNHFNTVVSYSPSVSTVLAPEVYLQSKEADGSLGELDAYEIEGAEEGGSGQQETLANLSEFHFASLLYNASLENATSEQGARMSAMDNSTRNAKEMLERLTLSYNRSRQATITTELIEIISGAAALEAST
eukprot:SM000245S08189  [mRNA]  locus=s245:57896:60344:- [translate_table: standard]